MKQQFLYYVLKHSALNKVHNKHNTGICENAAILVACAQEFTWLLSTIMTHVTQNCDLQWIFLKFRRLTIHDLKPGRCMVLKIILSMDSLVAKTNHQLE